MTRVQPNLEGEVSFVQGAELGQVLGESGYPVIYVSREFILVFSQYRGNHGFIAKIREKLLFKEVVFKTFLVKFISHEIVSLLRIEASKDFYILLDAERQVAGLKVIYRFFHELDYFFEEFRLNDVLSVDGSVLLKKLDVVRERQAFYGENLESPLVLDKLLYEKLFKNFELKRGEGVFLRVMANVFSVVKIDEHCSL